MPNETAWGSERIAALRRLFAQRGEIARPLQGTTLAALADLVPSLLDALEEARRDAEEARAQAAIDREQCDRMTREAANLSERISDLEGELFRLKSQHQIY